MNLSVKEWTCTNLEDVRRSETCTLRDVSVTSPCEGSLVHNPDTWTQSLEEKYWVQHQHFRFLEPIFCIPATRRYDTSKSEWITRSHEFAKNNESGAFSKQTGCSLEESPKRQESTGNSGKSGKKYFLPVENQRKMQVTHFCPFSRHASHANLPGGPKMQFYSSTFSYRTCMKHFLKRMECML